MTSYKTSAINNIQEPMVLQITNNKVSLNPIKQTACVINKKTFSLNNVIVTRDKGIALTNKKTILLDDDQFYERMSEDDIIQILPEGKINILWEKRINPYDIVLFITNNCNAKCVMCPQPPGKDEFPLFDTNKILLTYLKSQPIRKIGITGGEPTLKEKDLIELLQISYQIFPNAKVDLLTNAKKLSNFDYAKSLCLANPNITFCISFPSDNENDFDHILHGKIFIDAIQAIQNLAKLRQDIELRIVISRLNSNRLLNIAEYIYRNFPFISHITYMGMEVVGYAFDNYEQIKVYPNDYKETLYNAVQYLNQRNMNVSIYNLPYCLIDQKLWKFLRNSISSWKQKYELECNICSKKDSCPGIFATNQLKNYELKPIM